MELWLCRHTVTPFNHEVDLEKKLGLRASAYLHAAQHVRDVAILA